MNLPLPIAIDSLVARAAAGEREAVEALVGRWARPIRRWCLAALGDAARADDAAQDAVLKVLKGLPSVDPARPFEPWLRTVVRHACTDQHRRRARAREAPEVDHAHRPDPTRALDLDTGARHALQALQELTERQRQVLLLVDHTGCSPTEAARQLGVAPGTVRATLHTARRVVRTHLLATRPELRALLEDA